jgi:hypothetical protein
MSCYLFLNEELCVPLCQTAAMTYWQPNVFFIEGIMDRLDVKDIPCLKDDLVQDFLNSTPLYGLMAVLFVKCSPVYYLIWTPNRNAPATLTFVKDHYKFTGTIKKRIERKPLLENFANRGRFKSSWSESFDIYTPTGSIVLFSHTRKRHNFSSHVDMDVKDKSGTWDEITSGVPQVLSHSKVNETKCLKRKLKSVFSESKRRQDESHVIPDDIVDLLLSEVLQTANDQASSSSLKKNQIRSKDSGGYNTLLEIPKSTPLKDNSKIPLSDYHIATGVRDAYKLKYTQSSILHATKAVSDCLLSHSILSDNPDHNKVIGALSDKLYEGIEFRMVPETKCAQEFVSITVDIDQVCYQIYIFL